VLSFIKYEGPLGSIDAQQLMKVAYCSCRCWSSYCYYSDPSPLSALYCLSRPSCYYH